MVAFNGGIQPGIILLREGTDTSQVKASSLLLLFFLVSRSFLRYLLLFAVSVLLSLSAFVMDFATNDDFLLLSSLLSSVLSHQNPNSSLTSISYLSSSLS